MTSLEDAIDLIATHLANPGTRHVPLAEAEGGILRDEIVLAPPGPNETEPLALPAGARLTAAHLSALHLAEIHTVQISQAPTLTLACPRGDGPELFALERQLLGSGLVRLERTPFPSDADALPGRLAEVMASHRNLVLTAVDLPWRDQSLTPLLKTLGFDPLIQEAAILPGGKLWFGQSRSQETVLALHGDTYAHLVVAHRVLAAALRRLLRANEPHPEQVSLEKDVRFSHALTLLAPARLKYDYHGAASAEPMSLRAGQEKAVLARSDGYLEFSRYRDFFQQGEIVPFYRWSS